MGIRLAVSDVTVAIPGRILLDHVSFTCESGTSLALTGPSGSGKTSLLNCLAGISVPQSGTVQAGEKILSKLSESNRANFRLRSIGMVFQYGELLPELTVLDNVALPLRFAGTERDVAYARAREVLELVGLEDKLERHPDVLSGGETQRVGIARALSSKPGLILADEPTGMLDEANAEAITAMLVQISRESGATVVYATHDPKVAAAADRHLRLREGRLFEEVAA